ncbi:MAG: WbqC family protein [Chloroflexi bacterium]|nr:WbqC family protein [Chloroflexota bacterium]
MKVAIHQPQYLPWLGYLAKWSAADVFVFLDTVQYEKNGWQNRNRIKTRDGAAWLTVPVRAPLGTPIHAVAIETREPWRRRHARAIAHAYAGAPGFARFRPALDALYARPWEALSPLAIASAGWLAEAFGITTPTRLASDLGVTDTDPTGRLVALCRALGADTYLAGHDGLLYMDLAQFARAGITVLCQAYTAQAYPQQHGAFLPNLSALDLLLNAGADGLAVLRAGDHWERPEAGDDRVS